MTHLQEDMGISDQVTKLLEGSYESMEETTKEMKAWMEAVRRTEKEREAPIITGIVTKNQYQQAFKVATESTSPESTHRLDYTIWKAMASSDYCAEFLCVMMSPP